MQFEQENIFDTVKPNMTPGETFRQETVSRHIDNNFLLVVNKIVRSKSQTRIVDMKHFYHSLCVDKTTQAEYAFHNKTLARAKVVMKRMIDLREDCQKHLIEFRNMRKQFQKEIKECKDVIQMK